MEYVSPIAIKASSRERAKFGSLQTCENCDSLSSIYSEKNMLLEEDMEVTVCILSSWKLWNLDFLASLVARITMLHNYDQWNSGRSLPLPLPGV